ncbi:hypothetical protein FRC09_005081 [Ceratobasidium sp. 395]|nr:hypothetical protein FRC09_005081 [Ceratobasidium sp. 395]
MSEGTMYNHCRRVTKAIRGLHDLYIKWPNEDEHREIKLEAQTHGFPGAVGAVDGSYIPLIDWPHSNPMAYRTRKKTWAWNIQLVVDWDGRILAYDTGWPGCTSDRTMLRNSHIFTHRDKYFSLQEYILADSGYFLSQWVIMPYQEFEYGYRRRLLRQWNRAYSWLRIVVEHTFGRLKMRFPYLAGIWGYDMDQMLRAIESLFVVHNILLRLGDLPDGLDGLELQELLLQEHEAEVQRRAEQRAQPAPVQRNNLDTLRVWGWELWDRLVDRWAQLTRTRI